MVDCPFGVVQQECVVDGADAALHVLDLAADDFLTWRRGDFATQKPFTQTARISVSGSGLKTVMYETAHLEDLLNNRLGSVKGWRAALTGMKDQVRAKETTTAQVLEFLVLSALRRTYDYRGGLVAEVHGRQDGKPVTSVRRTRITADSPPVWRDLEAVTGACAAAFILLALDRARPGPGAFAPEEWARPGAFYRALEQVGVPRREIMEESGP